MSLGCARCGACCDPVDLNPVNAALVEEWREFFAQGGERSKPWTSDSVPFILEHWTEIPSPDDDGWRSYRCDQFNPETRECMAHDNRPDVCREFPHYGGAGFPLNIAGMAPQCSYLLDVNPSLRPEGSRPLIPITVRSTA